MSYTLQNPFINFFAPTNGKPLAGGLLYVGLQDEDPEQSPVDVYAVQPDGSELLLSQPITLLAGGVPSFGGSPVQLKIDAETVSLKVETSAGAQVYYTPQWSVPSSGMVSSSALANVNSSVSIAGVTASDLASAYNKRRVDIREFGIVFDGTDEGAKLRTALASGMPLYFPANKTIIVDYDPASSFSDGGTIRYSRCIGIPSNADLMFAPNFTIKGANGLKSWTRIVAMENVSGIKIYGTMHVDGNVQNISTPNNEQMHSIFMFNVKNAEIDTLSGINSRGDNVFIGGSDEVNFSDNVRIRAVIGKTAGRKNLVLHMADNLQIDYALLDNSQGGAAIYGGVPDDTDKHCLDLEPDVFTATKVFRQYIGNLRTFGLGNDFTVGVTPQVADAWQLTIGEAYCRQSAPMTGTVKAWLQYGVTINILGDLQIVDCDGVDEPIFLQYAARLTVGGKIKINGSCPTTGGAIISAFAASGDANTPRIRAAEIDIASSNGGGVKLRSCHLLVETLKLRCPAFGLIIGDNVSTAANKAISNIGRLIAVDTGSSYVVSIDTPLLPAPFVTVGEVINQDSRGTKSSYFFDVGIGNSENFTVALLTELSGVPLANWQGTDKYLKTAAQQYICQGTPDGMIPARVGSIASRIDGGAGTSFYVKESGSTASGWVAK